MHPAGFIPTISAVQRPQNYALDRAATGTGYTVTKTPNWQLKFHFIKFFKNGLPDNETLDTPLKAVNNAIIIFVTYFRPSACNRSSSAGRIRVKIDTVAFIDGGTYWNFGWNRTQGTETLLTNISCTPSNTTFLIKQILFTSVLATHVSTESCNNRYIYIYIYIYIYTYISCVCCVLVGLLFVNTGNSAGCQGRI